MAVNVSSISLTEQKSWERYIRDARKFESEIDAKLQEISRILQSLQRSSTPMDHDEETGLLGESQGRSQIQECISLLNQMQTVVHKLVGHQVAQQSNVKAALAQRMKEVYARLDKEFRQLNRKFETKQEENALFAGVSHHANGRENVNQGTHHLLRERGSLHQSHQATDDILSQAMSTRDTLQRDRQSLLGSAHTLGTAIGSFPGIQTLIQRIQEKQTRDSTILALVIAACICFTLWYIFFR